MTSNICKYFCLFSETLCRGRTRECRAQCRPKNWPLKRRICSQINSRHSQALQQPTVQVTSSSGVFFFSFWALSQIFFPVPVQTYQMMSECNENGFPPFDFSQWFPLLESIIEAFVSFQWHDRKARWWLLNSLSQIRPLNPEQLLDHRRLNSWLDRPRP